MKDKEKTKADASITSKNEDLLTMEAWLSLVDEIEIKEDAKQVYKMKVMLKVYLYMLIKGIIGFKTMHNHLKLRPDVMVSLGLETCPHRTTLSRRFKALPKFLREQIRCLHREFVEAGETMVEVMSVDSSLMGANGNVWHKSDREQGVIPSCGNIDTEAHWGKSGCGEWVYGYRVHCVVSSPAECALPFDIEVEAANIKDAKVFKDDFSQHLPQETRLVLGDNGFDDQGCYDLCDAQDISLITPIKAKKTTPPDRLERVALYNDHDVQEVFVLRKTTVEPFQGQLKALFNLKHLPLKGLDNVRALATLSAFAYLLLAKLNCRAGLDILKLQDTLFAIS